MDSFGVLFNSVLAAASLIFWKSHFFPGGMLRRNAGQIAVWCVLMAACESTVLAVLCWWSAQDVRKDPGTLTAYFVASLLWIFGVQACFEFFGVSLRDDVVERNNRGAGFTVAGFSIGTTCCVAGSQVGNGPGPEVVLLCAVLATGTLLILWMLLATFADAAEAITVERDAGAGIRAGGWLAGCGLALGTAVAGDWVSLEATVRDLARFGWPLFAVAVVFISLERQMNRRALGRRLTVFHSALVVVILVAAAAMYASWVVKQ